MVVLRRVVCLRKDWERLHWNWHKRRSVLKRHCLFFIHVDWNILNGASGIRLVELPCPIPQRDHYSFPKGKDVQRCVPDSFHQDEFCHRMGASHMKIHYFLRFSRRTGFGQMVRFQHLLPFLAKRRQHRVGKPPGLRTSYPQLWWCFRSNWTQKVWKQMVPTSEFNFDMFKWQPFFLAKKDNKRPGHDDFFVS